MVFIEVIRIMGRVGRQYAPVVLYSLFELGVHFEPLIASVGSTKLRSTWVNT